MMYKQNKEILHYVYRIDAFGHHYFGYTTNVESRMWGHCKSVRMLLKIGDFVLQPKESGKLHLHHFIAASMRKKKIQMNHAIYHIKMSVVFVSENKKDAIDVEKFLIIKSGGNNKCFNKKL